MGTGQGKMRKCKLFVEHMGEGSSGDDEDWPVYLDVWELDVGAYESHGRLLSGSTYFCIAEPRFDFSATYSLIRTVLSLFPFLLTTHVTVHPYVLTFLLPASLPLPTSTQGVPAAFVRAIPFQAPWCPFGSSPPSTGCCWSSGFYYWTLGGWEWGVGEKDWRIGGLIRREFRMCE